MKDIGITQTRYEMKSNGIVHFWDENGVERDGMSDSYLVMKDGLQVVLGSEVNGTLSSKNSEGVSFTISVSLNKQNWNSILYIIGCIYFLAWIALIQGILFLETIDYKERKVKLRARVIYFIIYGIIQIWMNLISLFLTTTYYYKDFLCLVTRIASNVSIIVFWLAIFLAFFRESIERRKFIAWSLFVLALFTYIVLWIFVFYPFLAYAVMLNSSMYIGSNYYFWIITIILNFIFRVRVAPLFFICLNVAIFVSFFGTQMMRPSTYFSAYPLWVFCLVFLSHLIFLVL